MNRYEVLATIWSDEHKKQIKKVIGEFDRFVNARLFADAYNTHYCTTVEIVEYRRV